MPLFEVYESLWIPITIAFFGAWFFIPALRHLLRSRAAASWTTTLGTVLSTTIKESQAGETTSNPSGYTVYRPVIAYEYNVDGKRFEGDRRLLGADIPLPDEVSAKRVIDASPPGSPVTVFYDPARPQNAALQVNRPSRLRLIGGGIMLFAGLLLVLAILADPPPASPVGAAAPVIYQAPSFSSFSFAPACPCAAARRDNSIA